MPNLRGLFMFFGGHDNNTKKLHSIPYHTVTHWNSVINPSFTPIKIVFTPIYPQ